jgi:hypothetical protein
VETLLKALVTQRHLQRYGTFRVEYELAAARLASGGEGLRAPSRAQFFRWLDGHLKGGVPYPDACRVLEAMFPGWTAAELFGPPPPADGWRRRNGDIPSGANGLLGSIAPSFPAEILAGAWVTTYDFSDPGIEGRMQHVDVTHLTAVSDRNLTANNYSPAPRTEGHRVPYRNVIEALLAGRQLVGHWRNTSDARYFGTVQLAALPGENVLTGHYTSYHSDIEVNHGHWTWVRLDPASLADVDLDRTTLRDPGGLAELLNAYNQYDPPLPLAAIVEETET